MNRTAFAHPLTTLNRAFTPFTANQCSQRCLRKMKPPHRPLTLAQQIQPPPETGQGSVENGQVRVRQHVNPLARRWSQPLQLPDAWYSQAFQDPCLPLVVDVGVAKGRFLAKLAAADTSRNFLGLEIREPLVHQANRAAANAGLGNLFYLACNANVSLAHVLADAPKGVLREIYVQFCDPWFKKRHAKRRIVNPPLVDEIFHALRRAQGEDSEHRRKVFIQSDVLEVAVEMRTYFDEHGGFKRLGESDELECDVDGWLVRNPLGLPTEREIAVFNKGGVVFRALYTIVEREEQHTP